MPFIRRYRGGSCWGGTRNHDRRVRKIRRLLPSRLPLWRTRPNSNLRPAVGLNTCTREGLGALGSRIGFNRTPVVRTITGLYTTYGERERLASISHSAARMVV